jgi:hypothetical protein
MYACAGGGGPNGRAVFCHGGGVEQTFWRPHALMPGVIPPPHFHPTLMRQETFSSVSCGPRSIAIVTSAPPPLILRVHPPPLVEGTLFVSGDNCWGQLARPELVISSPSLAIFEKDGPYISYSPPPPILNIP